MGRNLISRDITGILPVWSILY